VCRPCHGLARLPLWNAQVSNMSGGLLTAALPCGVHAAIVACGAGALPCLDMEALLPSSLYLSLLCVSIQAGHDTQ
jgi:hypothetical protein